MTIKYDPQFKKGVNKVVTIIVIVFCVGCIIGFSIGETLSLDVLLKLLLGYLLGIGFSLPIIVPHMRRLREKYSVEETLELKNKTKEYIGGVYVYLTLSIIPTVVALIFFILIANQSFLFWVTILPICLFLFGITGIINALNYKHNKNYYRTALFKMYGDEVDKYLNKMYKIFIILGSALILLSGLHFLFLLLVSIF